MTAWDYYKTISRRFTEAGITEDDALLLMLSVLGYSRADWLMKRTEELSPDRKELLDSYAMRRCRREPLQQILGATEFYGLPFRVTSDVLCPRQDTERLVERALKDSENRRVLDLCTGSGCIAVAISHYGKPQSVTASDISEKALSIARENALKNAADITFVESDLFAKLSGPFDMIVTNPPYIPEDQMKGLMPEVLDYEPENALYGGPDGLDFYREIIPEAYRRLTDGGILLAEIGFDQGKSVPELFRAAGFSEITAERDYAGLDRVVRGVKKDGL